MNGLGKTISTLIAIERLMYDYFDIKKVLLIAPKKVAESTWAQETQKWSATRRLTVAKVLGSEKERIHALESDSDLYVINRENVQWLVEYYKTHRLNGLRRYENSAHCLSVSSY